MQKKHGTPPLLSAFCFITVFGGAPGRTRTVRPEKTSVLGLNNVDFGDTINIGYNVTLQSSPFKKFFGRAMFSCRKHSAAEGAAVTTKEFAKLCGVEKRTLMKSICSSLRAYCPTATVNTIFRNCRAWNPSACCNRRG